MARAEKDRGESIMCADEYMRFQVEINVLARRAT
jgi:hypothetical protein